MAEIIELTMDHGRGHWFEGKAADASIQEPAPGAAAWAVILWSKSGDSALGPYYYPSFVAALVAARWGAEHGDFPDLPAWPGGSILARLFADLEPIHTR